LKKKKKNLSKFKWEYPVRS